MPENMQADQEPRPRVTASLIIGGVLFVLSFFCPLLIPLVLILGLPGAWEAMISGLLLFGIPEIMAIVGAGIMGRNGCLWLKDRMWAMLRRARPTGPISRRRYNIGLAMFILPTIFSGVSPFLQIEFPGYGAWRVPANILSDLIFLISFFVLGGGFWDKIGALFTYDSIVKKGGGRNKC